MSTKSTTEHKFTPEESNWVQCDKDFKISSNTIKLKENNKAVASIKIIYETTEGIYFLFDFSVNLKLV